MRYRHGFTLVELLVVILIILAVSVVVLPTVVTAVQARKVDASAQLLQGAIVGARNRAILNNTPTGLRLVPNPSDPNSLVSLVPLDSGPNYTEGRINTFPGQVYPASITGGLPCLVVEEAPGHWQQIGDSWGFVPNPPASWTWNVRAGDKIVIGIGRIFTVCGPLPQRNADYFVNGNTLQRTYTAPDGITTFDGNPEYLLLVNGLDDNGDGFVDNGWDGIDNNVNGKIDEPSEWEIESWGSLGQQVSVPYTITRRPIHGKGQTVNLAAAAGIDLSQSSLPVNPIDGSVEIMVSPDGTISAPSLYAASQQPSLMSGNNQPSYRFFIGDQIDHHLVTLWPKTGQIETE